MNCLRNHMLLATAILAPAVFAGAAHAGTLTATNLGDGAVDLTALGTADWALYLDADLTPDEAKLGGSGLGALSFTADDPLLSANSSQSLLFSWTDGNPTLSSGGNTDPLHLATTAEDDSPIFSTSVVSSSTTNSLYISYGQWNALSRLTATLSDASATDVILDISGVDDHQTVRIDFASDTVATLDVKIEFVTDEGNNNSGLRFQALALANNPVPEPGSLALLGLGGLLIARRRRA